MKRGLQIVVGILSLIPLSFAVLGIVLGAQRLMPGMEVPPSLDNQFRYMSGVYLLVSFLIWWILPDVEKHGRIFALIVLSIFAGGLARLLSLVTVGIPAPDLVAGMFLELSLPLLIVWQRAVAKAAGSAG